MMADLKPASPLLINGNRHKWWFISASWPRLPSHKLRRLRDALEFTMDVEPCGVYADGLSGTLAKWPDDHDWQRLHRWLRFVGATTATATPFDDVTGLDCSAPIDLIASGWLGEAP